MMTDHASGRSGSRTGGADGSKRGGRKREAHFDNLANVILESLVEHAIGLIEYEPGNLSKGESSLASEIEETSWSTDDDARSLTDELLLVILGDSTVDADGGDGGKTRGDSREVGVSLHGQLAGGGDDEDRDGSFLGVGRVGREGEDVLQGGNSESDRLAGSVAKGIEKSANPNAERGMRQVGSWLTQFRRYRRRRVLPS